MSFLSKIVVTNGLNALIGVKALGAGAAGYLAPLGAYVYPSSHDGYTYNTDDGRWYETPPAPDHGQYDWENPADPVTESRLDIWRDAQNLINKIEKLSPDKPADWSGWWKEVMDWQGSRTFMS